MLLGCLCSCACALACMHARTNAWANARTHVRAHTHARTHTHTHTHSLTHSLTHSSCDHWKYKTRARAHTHTHIHTTVSHHVPPLHRIDASRPSQPPHSCAVGHKPFVWCSDSRVALSGVPGLRLLHVPLLHYCVHGNTFSWYPLFSQSFTMGATEYLAV